MFMKNKKLFKFLMTFVLAITMFVSMNVKAADLESCVAADHCTGGNLTEVDANFNGMKRLDASGNETGFVSSDYAMYKLYAQNNSGTIIPVFCGAMGVKYHSGNAYSATGKTYTTSGKVCGIVRSLNSKNGNITESDLKNYATNNSSYEKIQKSIWYYEKYEGNCTDNKMNVTDKTISLSLKISDSKMKMVDGYYISKPITISGSGLNSGYVVSLAANSNGFLPAGAFITTDANAKTGSASGATITADKIYVKIPAANVTSIPNFKVIVKGTGVVQTWGTFTVKLTEYSSGDWQPIVSLQYTPGNPGSKNGDVTKEISLYSESTSIKVVKTNKENKKPVANATFMLYDKNGKNAKTIDGKDVAAVKTDSNGMITFSNLYYDEDDYNTFVLHEVKPATGYKVIDDVKNQKIQFTIKNGSISITTKKEENKFFSVDSKTKNQINVVNEPIKQKFSKKDVANEDELEGAHIVIKDAKGKIVKEFDSTKKSTEFYLEPGKYTLTETVAPKGYVAIKTEFEFEVLENGDVKLLTTNTNKFVTKGETITLYNYPISVKVPDTGVKKTLYIIIGSILVLAGGALAYLKIKGIDKDIKFPFKKA